MDGLFLIFLSSGLFLGWSLGANDAANIFGTAVGTKMVKFRTAAIISSVFIILGAVFAGSGASQTLNRLGEVNTLAGAFMVALSAAVSVYSICADRIFSIFRKPVLGYGKRRRSLHLHGLIIAGCRIGRKYRIRHGNGVFSRYFKRDA